MRTQQRMSRNEMRSPPVLDSLALQDQLTMTPRRQRRVEEFTAGQQCGEINAGSRGEQISEQGPEPVRGVLATTHGGNRGHRNVERGCGLVYGTNQQGMRRQFGEHPETVFEGGLGRGREPDRVAQIVNPVVDVTVRLLARIEKRCRVIRNLGRQRRDVIEHPGQFLEDRLNLRGVRRDIDGYLTGHDLALLPLRDDPAHAFGGAADHRGGRGCHDGDHNILDTLFFQLLAHHVGGQFDSGHGAAAGDFQAQQRTTADHLDAVGQRQRAGNNGRGDLAQ